MDPGARVPGLHGVQSRLVKAVLAGSALTGKV